jgi:hypothetical protein
MSERKQAWMIAGGIISFAVAVTVAVFEVVLLVALYGASTGCRRWRAACRAWTAPSRPS